MLLLDKGRVVADRWTDVADDAALPVEGKLIFSLARFQAEQAELAARNVEIGVRVPSETHIESLEPLLDRVDLFVVEFPKFRDGRGFTIARSLRERYGYHGEIRAAGHVLPDQYVFLLRCGVNTVAVPEDAKIESWTAALGQFDLVYQPVLESDKPASLLRRHLAL